MSVRAVLAVALVAVFSAVAGYGLHRWLTQGPASATHTAGLRPDFTLPDLEGRPRSVKEWDGKVLVVNFWATWCPPCRREIPMFIEMQKRYGERGLQFLGIAVDNLEDVSHFAIETDINYPLLVGEQEAIDLSQQLGNTLSLLPFTAIIDRQGRVLATKAGELTRSQADKLLLPLLSDHDPQLTPLPSPLSESLFR
jgi:thiol-disulfide isomerase/thioredoxin